MMLKVRDYKNINGIDITNHSWLEEDIKKNGIKRAVLVHKETGNIFEGLHRVAIAKKLGIEEVPCIEVECSPRKIMEGLKCQI